MPRGRAQVEARPYVPVFQMTFRLRYKAVRNRDGCCRRVSRSLHRAQANRRAYPIRVRLSGHVRRPVGHAGDL